MKATWAYDFVCDRPMAEIFSTINESGPWRWIERDKDAFGPYISSMPFEGLRVRIYDLHGYYSNGPTYTADFKMDEECKVRRSLIDDVFRELLGKLSAHNITNGEYYD
ncbi:MAG: hypothetical protein M3371_06800 [Acidobacteriota bacterium]|nr:hypothetical protein [Acidobacteriota bacterium]